MGDHDSEVMGCRVRWSTEAEIDYAVGTIKENVAKLRELSPLWEMFKDGVDLSTIQWAAH